MTAKKDAEIAELKAKVAELESRRPVVNVYAPERTYEETYLAQGHTRRELRKHLRQISHMQNHY